MEYDVFISYAKEDEGLAERLAGEFAAREVRAFFAPLELRADDINPHEKLLAAVKASRNVLLLWSPFVDKSEWVALETSIYTTYRSGPGQRTTGLIILDLGGPELPGWLPYDAVLRRQELDKLASHFGARQFRSLSEFESTLYKDTQQPWLVSAARTLWQVLTARGWSDRCRLVFPRLGPDFSLSDLRVSELNRLPVAVLLRDCLVALIAPAILIAGVCLAMWGGVLTYPHDFQGYVSKEVLFAAAASIAAGLIVSIRIGVAAAITTSFATALAGCAAAMSLAFFRRPDPLSGSFGIGVTLGIAAAVPLAFKNRARAQGRFFRIGPEPILGTAFTIGLIAAAQALVQCWAHEHPNPGRLDRAVLTGGICALVFAPVGAIAAWLAHYNVRLRFWRFAAWIGFAVWALLVTAAACLAAYVPFGSPFDWRDGLGVGALSGAAAAGVATILASSVQGITGRRWAPTWAVLIILLIAVPVLRQFENLHPNAILEALCAGALLSWTAAMGFRRYVSFE